MTQIAAIQAQVIVGFGGTYNIMHLLGGEVQDITESAVDINASPTTQNTIEITAVSSAATETEDITQTWLPGDLCQLYVHSDGVATVYVSNFQLAYDNSATVAVASTNS